MRTYRFWFNDENFRIVEARCLEEALDQLSEEERALHSFTEMPPARGLTDIEAMKKG